MLLKNGSRKEWSSCYHENTGFPGWGVERAMESDATKPSLGDQGVEKDPNNAKERIGNRTLRRVKVWDGFYVSLAQLVGKEKSRPT